MKYKPLISIIVPIYKTENYLSRCVQSIINQSYFNIEIILVDDGSPDKCPVICDNLSLIDSRIRVIHKKNGGISSARNAGLDYMTGDYVTFIDSDDYIYKDLIKNLILMCTKYNCEISACALHTGSENNFDNVLNKGSIVIYNKFEAFFSRRIKAGIVGKLYKAILFSNERFPISDHFNYEDEALTYKLVYNSNKIAITDKKMYYYFQSPISMTRNKNYFKTIDFIEVLEKRNEYFKHKEENLFELSLEYYCLCLMLFYISCKKDKHNTNNKDDILTIYKSIYKKVLNNSITPIHYKFMFTTFYLAPNWCSLIINTLHLR